jgi:hypothetical protein
MKVTVQLLALAALPPGKESPVSIVQESGWAPERSGSGGEEKIPLPHLREFIICIHTDIRSCVACEFYKAYLNKPRTNNRGDTCFSTLQCNLIMSAHLFILHLSSFTWRTDILEV